MMIRVFIGMDSDMGMRFVIVGHVSLGMEPVLDYLEEFVPLHRYLFDRSDYVRMSELDSEGRLIKVGEDPCEFLASAWDSGGLVIRYHEVRDRLWFSVWSCLRHEFPIVHIKRRDVVEVYIRHRLRKAEPPIWVDPDLLSVFVATYEQECRDYDDALSPAKYYDLFLDDWPDQEVSLCNYIGVSSSGLATAIPPLNIPSLVQNYKELSPLLRTLGREA